MALHWIANMSAEAQQTSRRNRRRRGIDERSIFGRSVVIPGWNAIRRCVGNVIVGAGFGGVQEARVAAIFVGSSKAVKRPSEPARPAGIAAKPLLGRLPQKFSSFEIEDSFMCG